LLLVACAARGRLDQAWVSLRTWALGARRARQATGPCQPLGRGRGREDLQRRAIPRGRWGWGADTHRRHRGREDPSSPEDGGGAGAAGVTRCRGRGAWRGRLWVEETCGQATGIPVSPVSLRELPASRVRPGLLRAEQSGRSPLRGGAVSPPLAQHSLREPAPHHLVCSYSGFGAFRGHFPHSPSALFWGTNSLPAQGL
jgi:hypothetical protein